MPQLIPAPWLIILLFTWFVFLTILPPKVLAHTFPNVPSPQSTQKPKKEPWTWLWH
uniref:ATP synthase complex subunit 8 n=1 Tax=Micropercops swinhonis TaxID=86241 RepID=S5DUQ7_9GOBI|nr:ATP synthase F0 subunit 8 [Micropercops swinhonis]AGQ17396.1 ATP synthase F0 subunit 8 [Micropercops swinhonis]